MHARLRRPAVALITTALAASVLGIVPAASAIATGTVSGTVTSAGAPVVGIEVTVYQYNDEYEYWDYADDTSTTGNGTYSLALPEGEYRIGFQDFDGGRYVEEFYDNAPDVEAPQAVTLTVDDAQPVVANADLAAAAHITGTVLGTGNAALQDIQVTAWQKVVENPGTPDEDVYYDYAGRGETDSLGRYDVGGLPGGTFRIEFEDTRFQDDVEYATEYYDDQPSLAGDGTADLVLAPAATRGNINATLAPDSEITGTVTDAAGPLENAEIDVQTKVGSRWQFVGYTQTDEDGKYTVEGLRAGTYRVRFIAYFGNTRAVEWWKNVGRRINATDVVLGQNTTSSPVDAQLVVDEHDDETAPELTNTALPTISGEPFVGRTLTATGGSWSPIAPSDLYYGWFRDGVYLEGTDSPTYVLTSADLGASMTVGVYAIDDEGDYDAGYAESAKVGPVTVAPVVTPPVVTPPVVTPPAPVVDVPTALAKVLAALEVSGKPKVGKTVKVTGLDLDLRTAVSYRFQWFAGKKAIKKATKSKLKITQAMKGKKISVKVTAKAASATKSVKIAVGKVK